MSASHSENPPRSLEQREEITHLNAHTSPLLLLPPELRNTIYRSAFLSTVVLTEPPKLKSTHTKHDLRGTPALLLSCRQIHAEANHLYWSLSTFDLSETGYGAVHWFAPQCEREMVTSLVLDEYGSQFLIRMIVWNCFLKNLKTLTVKKSAFGRKKMVRGRGVTALAMLRTGWCPHRDDLKIVFEE